MLAAKSIYKSYGEVKVLQNVSLVIEPGEVVAIVGASGAGKSTLLQILGTLEKPDSGEVTLDNQQLTTLDPDDLAIVRNQEIGFIFQFHNLMAELTALENVSLPAWIAGKPDEEVRKQALQLMDLLNLSHRTTHYPSELSGGEQQRVAVARSLINKPKVVLADEPSGNLDTQNAEELHRLFFKVRMELGCSFVIVTHNELFADMADRKVTIKDGKIS